jgi:hypothetical protein
MALEKPSLSANFIPLTHLCKICLAAVACLLQDAMIELTDVERKAKDTMSHSKHFNFWVI